MVWRTKVPAQQVGNHLPRVDYWRSVRGDLIAEVRMLWADCFWVRFLF